VNLLLKGIAMLSILTQAVLPDGLATDDHSIAAMEVGEQGWTTPWAMYHDNERRLWLNGSYPLYASPGGTAEMLISRDHNGWNVDATQVAKGYRWSSGGYVGDFTPVPVASFVKHGPN
jgi:hypothetical protein